MGLSYELDVLWWGCEGGPTLRSCTYSEGVELELEQKIICEVPELTNMVTAWEQTESLVQNGYQDLSTHALACLRCLEIKHA